MVEGDGKENIVVMGQPGTGARQEPTICDQPGLKPLTKGTQCQALGHLLLVALKTYERVSGWRERVSLRLV
jgi:hypothetical protein